MRDRSYDESMAEIYAENPALAVDLLNSIFEDGTGEDLMILMRQFSRIPTPTAAQGVSPLPPPLPLMTLTEGDSIAAFAARIKSMGFRLAVERVPDQDAFHFDSANKAA